MAQHDVKFDVPLRPLGYSDVRFIVDRNGERFGELRVSKGNIVWYAKDKKNGVSRSWKQLAAFFKPKRRKRNA